MRALDRASCMETGHHSDVVPMIAICVLVFRLGMSLIYRESEVMHGRGKIESDR